MTVTLQSTFFDWFCIERELFAKEELMESVTSKFFELMKAVTCTWSYGFVKDPNL